LYNGKAKSGGPDASQLKRIKELEEEHSKLKQMYTNVSLQRYAPEGSSRSTSMRAYF